MKLSGRNAMRNSLELNILCCIGAAVCWLMMLATYPFIHKRWMQNKAHFCWR